MCDELFKKVNKRRGLKLRNISLEIKRLAEKGEEYANFNFKLVEKILKRINQKELAWELDPDNSIEDDYDPLFNIDYSIAEKAAYDIASIFIRIEEYLKCLTFDGEDKDEDDTDCVTDMILELRGVIEDRVNNIIGKISEKWDDIQDVPIRREKVRKDIYYTIYVLEEVKTELLKIRKDLASLYAWD